MVPGPNAYSSGSMTGPPWGAMVLPMKSFSVPPDVWDSVKNSEKKDLTMAAVSSAVV